MNTKNNNTRTFTYLKIFLCFLVILLIGTSCDPDDNLIRQTGERLVPEMACNRAAVSHVNLPDGSIIEPLSGEVEKIWPIK